MKTSDLTGSGLDLISLRKKEEYREFWRDIKREFFRELRKRKYYPTNRSKDEETERGAENFALAAVALSRLFDGIKNVIKGVANSKVLEGFRDPPSATKSDLLTNDFNYAQYENRISEQAHKVLHDFANVALGDQAEEFNLKRKWVEHAKDKEFIGPLPEAFEAFRRANNKSLLINEFKEHSEALAKSDIGYHIDNNTLVFSEALVREKEKMYPLCDGKTGCTVDVFKLKAESQVVYKPAPHTPQIMGDLAPAYAHK